MENIPKKRSCADKLHKIQKELGYSQKELIAEAKALMKPREVSLPVFHEKVPKSQRKQMKVEKKLKKNKRYYLAYLYLHKFLKKKYRNAMYRRYPDFEELVNHCYEEAMAIIEFNKILARPKVDQEQIALGIIQEQERMKDPSTAIMPPRKRKGSSSIPDEQWDAFCRYCEKHPIKSAKDIIPRRQKFLKSLRKRNKKYYSKKSMKMYDPVYRMDVCDKKEMIKNLKRINYENELRVREFHKMLDSLCADKSIGSSAMKKFDKQTAEVMKRSRAHIRQMMAESGIKPTVISFDIDDEPRRYCD